MCGRFTLRTPAKEIAQLFDVTVPDFDPRYNIAPSQDVAAVRFSPEKEKREFVFLQWNLVPFWADEPKTKYSLINARAETVAEKRSFREAFRKRRCLILADGFYEWQKRDGKKQPYFMHMKDDRPFAFAGLWEHWHGDDEELESCTIIVTEANELLKPIHDRMPVILDTDDYDLWLDPKLGDKQRLQELLRPYSSEEMEAYPVSTLVNKPQNDMEKCVKPVEE
ncbi:MAG: SOS response-associated peptidase [Candidatus Paceibacterota bacterium]